MEMEWTAASIADLQNAMAAGDLTARGLTTLYLQRIAELDHSGPCIRSVIEVNPDAWEIAARLDAERTRGVIRGPLHGIPILLKDNIDTGDGMQTTAGSLAMVGPPAPCDAGVVVRLRDAGAVLLGKTNLSEWANFRGRGSTSGWSARGGLTRNPHALDRSAGGSSSGSGAAAAAGFCAAAVGTETDGSIVSPATACGVVGIKPTVGLTSRGGIVPISQTQDSVGALARTVPDAAAVLAAMAAGGADPRDPSTAGHVAAAAARALSAYRRWMEPGGLQGARIGVPRGLYGRSRHGDAVAEEALAAMRDAGATVVDPAEIPTLEAMRDASEQVVMRFEFRTGLNAYLAQREGLAVRTLSEVIAFNEAHASTELGFFGQEHLLEAEACGALTDPAYLSALAHSRSLAGPRGLDAVLDGLRLDALVAPTGGPAWTADLLTGDHGSGGTSSPAARCGYPLISVPAGEVHGLPINITFMGRAFSEPVLLRLAYAFEVATRARRPPGFLPTARLT